MNRLHLASLSCICLLSRGTRAMDPALSIVLPVSLKAALSRALQPTSAAKKERREENRRDQALAAAVTKKFEDDHTEAECKARKANKAEKNAKRKKKTNAGLQGSSLTARPPWVRSISATWRRRTRKRNKEHN